MGSLTGTMGRIFWGGEVILDVCEFNWESMADSTELMWVTRSS